MTPLKRLPVKYIRDFAKSAYEKKNYCYICGATENLEFHHFSSVNELFKRWCKKNKIKIEYEEDILAHRGTFIDEHYDEIYNQTVTFCSSAHEALHKVYGKSPKLGTAKKQERWVEKKKEAYESR